MAAKAAAALLAKDFVVVKIDTDRMTGGKEMIEATKGSGQGIPWFEFLDAEGAVLADSNGPKGNIGCPYEPDEIDYFITLIKKVKAALSDEDVEALKKSLLAQREKK